MLLIFRNNLEIDGFYTWHFQKAQYLTEWGKKNIPIYQINKKKKNQSRTTEDEVKVGDNGRDKWGYFHRTRPSYMGPSASGDSFRTRKCSRVL